MMQDAPTITDATNPILVAAVRPSWSIGGWGWGDSKKKADNKKIVQSQGERSLKSLLTKLYKMGRGGSVGTIVLGGKRGEIKEGESFTLKSTGI